MTLIEDGLGIIGKGGSISKFRNLTFGIYLLSKIRFGYLCFLLHFL